MSLIRTKRMKFKKFRPIHYVLTYHFKPEGGKWEFKKRSIWHRGHGIPIVKIPIDTPGSIWQVQLEYNTSSNDWIQQFYENRNV